jgi:hypothetical protein
VAGNLLLDHSEQALAVASSLPFLAYGPLLVRVVVAGTREQGTRTLKTGKYQPPAFLSPG